MGNILVVDDSLVMRKKIRAMLTKAGHNVIAEAETGEQAIRRYNEFQPDLVTLDITMPTMDGLEAVKKIMGAFPDARIVMVSAVGQRSMVLDAIQSGAKNYIIKPFEEEKAISVINGVLMHTLSTAKKQEELNEEDFAKEKFEADKGTESKQPFTIENRCDYFKVDIFETINENTHLFLNTAIQGLLFIKPLKILVNFTDCKKLSDKISDDIFNILKCIIISGATLKVVSKNEEFVKFINVKKYGIIVSKIRDNEKIEF